MLRFSTFAWLLAPGAFVLGCLTPVGYDRNADGGGGTGGAGAEAGGVGTGGVAPGMGGTAGSGARGGAVGAGGGAGGLTGVAGRGGVGGTLAVTGTAGTTGAAGTIGTAGTGGTPPPPGTVLYMDNFESDTAGGMAAGWIQGDTDPGLGTWSVVSDGSNVLQGVATGSSFTVDIGGDVSWTDYTFQVDAKMISGTSWDLGVYGRFALGTDKANFYEAYMDDSGSVQLRVKKDGSTTTLGSKSKATTPPTLNTTYTFKLDMHGSIITVYVDGVMRGMATDVTLASGGIGVIVEGGTAEFDNVVVTE